MVVTGEPRKVADISAASVYCACTVGTELVGRAATYGYAERRGAVVGCVVSFVSALGSHCALISKPIFSRCSLPNV